MHNGVFRLQEFSDHHLMQQPMWLAFSCRHACGIPLAFDLVLSLFHNLSITAGLTAATTNLLKYMNVSLRQSRHVMQAIGYRGTASYKSLISLI